MMTHLTLRRFPMCAPSIPMQLGCPVGSFAKAAEAASAEQWIRVTFSSVRMLDYPKKVRWVKI